MSKAGKTINILLQGKGSLAKKFAGKHVFVIGDKVFPLKGGKTGAAEVIKLEKKYGAQSTLIFVPKPHATYILICRK